MIIILPDFIPRYVAIILMNKLLTLTLSINVKTYHLSKWLGDHRSGDCACVERDHTGGCMRYTWGPYYCLCYKRGNVIDPSLSCLLKNKVIMAKGRFACGRIRFRKILTKMPRVSGAEEKSVNLRQNR